MLEPTLTSNLAVTSPVATVESELKQATASPLYSQQQQQQQPQQVLKAVPSMASKPPSSPPISQQVTGVPRVAVVASPATTPSSGGSSGSFLSHVLKVPHTLKTFSLSLLSKKKPRTRPEDLFESESSYDEDEEEIKGGIPSSLAASRTVKRNSTNVDTKEYNLPIGSERKRRQSINSSKKPTKPLAKPIEPSPQINLDKSTPGCLAFIYGHTTNGEDATPDLIQERPGPLFSPSVVDQEIKTQQPPTTPTQITEVAFNNFPLVGEDPLPLVPQSTVAPMRTFGSNDQDIESTGDSDEEDEEERINPGYKEWKRRRRAWTKVRNPNIHPQESTIKHMSESDKVTVYKHMIIHNRRLKKPIPLSDVLVVLKAGWLATGQWPSKAM